MKKKNEPIDKNKRKMSALFSKDTLTLSIEDRDLFIKIITDYLKSHSNFDSEFTVSFKDKNIKKGKSK